MTGLHNPTERVLLILESLAREEKMTLSGLAQKTGILKGTIFPILKSLHHRKYVTYDPTECVYSLGVSCMALSSTTFEKEFWLQAVRAEMRNIVSECNEICQMGILEGASVLYIDKIQGEQTVQLNSKIGTRLPAIYSALGKALLYRHQDAQIMALYPEKLAPLTSHSIQNFTELRKQLDDVNRLGFAMDDREINEETICFAVPLQQKENIVAAVSVSLPYFRATEEKKSNVINSLLRAKERIELTLDKLPDIHN
ncbi:IclR family transcriptional regulator [Pectobacterium sp. B1J-3]|uniref:IclR family transcriptional regulator n=1 Tax=Pectobacterium sp. B1J-3 TaxID=3385371 RepID=UPI00390609A1